ncbi:hypothetical protein ACROYT_G002838 [Oculina patagonica]
MQCPYCGNTDLLPKFKCCPECGRPLPRPQNVPSNTEHGVSAQTLLQQSGASARGNSEHVVGDKKQIQGRERPDSSTGQQLGPIEQPDKDYGSVTDRHDQKPTEGRAGTLENDQRTERTPATSSDQGHEGAFGSKGPAGESNTISGSETPAEERVGLQKNDQRPESTLPTSSNEDKENAVDTKGAAVTNTFRETTGDHTMSGGAVPSTTPPLEGQREPITNEALQGDNAASETTVTASTATGTTKDENSAETVTGPAVLEESENPNAPDIQGTDSAGHDTTSEKTSNDYQTMPDDHKEQLGKGSVTEERKTSGKDPPTTGPTTTFTKPEEKIPETQHLLGSGSKLKDSKKYGQNLGQGSSGPLTRQAASRGNRNQPNASSASVPGRKPEPASQHPLGKPGKDDSSKSAKEQTEEYKVALFLHCIGSKALKTFNGFSFDDESDRKKLNKVIEKFEEYTVGRINETFERYRFNSRNQEPSEGIAAYVSALRNLTRTCNSGSLHESLVRDRIVFGVQTAHEFEDTPTSPYNSKGNGKVESAVKTAKRLLRKTTDAGTYSYLAILAHRNTPTQGMESSPAQRLMNRRTKILLPNTRELLKPHSVVPDMEITALRKRQEKQAQHHSKSAKKLEPLANGDEVRMKPFVAGKKILEKAMVKERLDERSYTVETANGERSIQTL